MPFGIECLSKAHAAFYVSNKENTSQLVEAIFSGELIHDLKSLKGALFSDVTLNKFMVEELRHGHFNIKTRVKNSLHQSSEGERKHALLKYLLTTNPDFLVVDNVYGSLDIAAQTEIQNMLEDRHKEITIIQISNRKADILPFIQQVYRFQKGKIEPYNVSTLVDGNLNQDFKEPLPNSYAADQQNYKSLIEFNNVSVSYQDRMILKNIYWTVKPGEFWKLTGPNGSGKSTMLSMIYGDNPKAYGQNIKLFGVQKGSGESVWDIKKRIGFFSADMVRGFARLDSIGNMIVSGFHDSVGLYRTPSNLQIKITQQWLDVLGMVDKGKQHFSSLSKGHQRLVLIARAMVKQPPLLILDEPTNGLDDYDAQLFARLVNKIASETNTAIIFVSHRKDEALKPDFIYELTAGGEGSIGTISLPNG